MSKRSQRARGRARQERRHTGVAPAGSGGIPPLDLERLVRVQPDGAGGMPRESLPPESRRRAAIYAVDPALRDRPERPKLELLLQHAARHHFESLIVMFPWVLHADPSERERLVQRFAQHGVQVHIVEPSDVREETILALERRDPGTAPRVDLSQAAIDRYVDDVLFPQLRAQARGEHAGALAQVCDDVRLRLASVLSRWADGPTRTHLLLVGQEEGQHYAPGSVPDDVRALVVVAVRNSLLEELCTSASRLVPAGESIIGDEQLAAITGEAVHFWRHLPLAPTSASVGTPAGDPFGHLARAYPHAYHVLDALASSPAPIVRFAACTAPPPPLLDSPSGGSVPARGVPPLRVGSGWDPALDDDLLAALHGVHAGTLGGLVLPTWKHCTRNTDKLYRVLDYVLGHGGRVVTVNYLLTPTYACRRVPLLKPAHDSRAVGLQVRDRTRLQPEHAQALEETWPAWAALEVADDER